MTRPGRVPFDLEQTLPLMVAQVILEAEAGTWRRRAAAFRAARSRPGDYHGRRTPAQVAEHDERVEAKAQACDARAALCEITRTEEDVVWQLLDAARTDQGRLAVVDHGELQATG